MLRIVLFLSVCATMTICHPLLPVEDAENEVFLVAKEDLPEGSLVKLRQQLYLHKGHQDLPDEEKTFEESLKTRAKRQAQIGITGNHVPGVGGSATISGKWDAINTPRDKLNIYGTHTQVFDHRLRPIGPGSNTAGLGYGHTSSNGRATWGLNADTQFGHGRRPAHNLGGNFIYRF